MYIMYIITHRAAQSRRMKRTQIYLDEGQDRELSRLARATGATKSELIRRAVERLLRPADDETLRLKRFRRAVDAAAGRAPDLPEGRVYVEGLRRVDAQRQRELEARRDR